MWATKQPYPNEAHLIGSFRPSRLPSRGKPLFTFLCCLVFTNLLGLVVAKDIGSSVIGIGLLLRVSMSLRTAGSIQNH